MEIEVFTICDSAQVYDNKLIIVGTFNEIRVPKAPIMSPLFSIVGRISYESCENGLKKYDIKLSDPTDKEVFHLSWTANVNISEGKVAYINFNFVANPFQITTLGVYNLYLKSEGIKRALKIFIEQK